MIVVGSLQYSPVYKSHCCALGRQAEKQGMDVVYLFSHNYEWMLPPSIKERTIFIGRSSDIRSALADGLNPKTDDDVRKVFREYRPDVCYMYNFHPFVNYKIARQARRKGVRFIQHVHEPHVENKSTYKGVKQYWLTFFEMQQKRLLEEVDVAVVSSDISYSLFKKQYPWFTGQLMKIPLIYEDLGKDVLISEAERKYVTFIGPPMPAKGSDTFLSVVDYAENNEFDIDFLLITRSEPGDRRYGAHRRLKVHYKDRISDEELGKLLSMSRMVFTPYTVSTQSSVVLTSYMYGAPALSSNVGGLPEFVQHKRTGYLLDVHASNEEWVSGINFISGNLEQMSSNCRKYFKENFSEDNWPRYFRDLFEEDT